jgi:uncharacterized phage-associated protein
MMGRKRLLALLYLADRESLKRIGRPIVGGRLAAMKFGPIHSEVYDLIKGSHRDKNEWSRYFENDGYWVVLAAEPEACALSRFEIGVLNEISAQYAGYDDWDVAEATHDLEEYKDTYRSELGSVDIPLERLIEGTGRGKDRAAILRRAEEKDYYDKLFAGGK